MPSVPPPPTFHWMVGRAINEAHVRVDRPPQVWEAHITEQAGRYHMGAQALGPADATGQHARHLVFRGFPTLEEAQRAAEAFFLGLTEGWWL